RKLVNRDPEVLVGQRADVAADDVGGGPDRDPDLVGAAFYEVGRDLGARVAGADDQHLLAPVRLRVAVSRGVNQLAGETVAARPVGDVRRVVVAGGDHHLLCLDLVGGGPGVPDAVLPVEALDPGQEPDRQAAGVV